MRKATRSAAAANVVAFPQQRDCRTGSGTKPGACRNSSSSRCAERKAARRPRSCHAKPRQKALPQPSALSAELIFFLKAPGISLTIDSCRACAYLSG